MKIKEAAQYCGLTEKAIRLYEAKGLICPRTEEKNGRTYREYDDKTIRTLLTVGILRRADFTIEQIGMMLGSPDRIGEVFASYKEVIRENSERLAALNRVMETMDAEDLCDIDRFADTLAESMTDGAGSTLPQPDTKEEMKAPAPPAVRLRHTVWDEELTKEEKERIYRQFADKRERRDRWMDKMLCLPRKIGGFFRGISEKIRAKTRDEQGRVKKSVKTFLAFLCVVAVLVTGLGSAWGKLRRIQNDCTYGIFWSMHDVVYALRNTVTTGRYTYGHSEVVCRNLALIEGYVDTADDVYYHAFNQISREYDGVEALLDAMGCTHTGFINSERAEAILYDGAISDKEMQFIELLYEDLSEVYAIMLAEDGLNRRDDLDYGMIHDAIHAFLDKWGEWRDMNYDTPYRLLLR